MYSCIVMAFYAHYNMNSGSVSSSSGLTYCARDVAEKPHKPTSFPKTFTCSATTHVGRLYTVVSLVLMMPSTNDTVISNTS